MSVLSADARRARRLGLLGGSFDPPHAGHLHLWRTARDAFELDHVVFVPAHRSPFKLASAPAPDAQRMRMLEILLEDEKDVSIWSGELERGGASYTIDTVRALADEAPEAQLFWILGSDNLAALARWRGIEEILSLVQPVVVARAGARLEPDLEGLSAAARGRVLAGLVDEPPHPASSTGARAALLSGKAPADLIPARVREYIAATGIYGGDDER